MIYRLETENNGISENLQDELYNDQKLKAIIRFSETQLPVHARVVGYTLLVTGSGKNFSNDLKINDIASRSGVSRSMTIHSLKLLVDLQIFHKQEEINKPCTYKYNLGEWLQYSTPEPKKRVVQIFGETGQEAESRGEENDSLPSALCHLPSAIPCGLPDTPQEEEESINAYPESMTEEDVSSAYKPAVKADKKPTIWRSPIDRDSVRYAQVGPIYDEPTGLEIQRRMDEEGLLPQQVVIEAISLSKGFRFLTAIAAVAGKICSDVLGIITNAMAAVDSNESTTAAETPRPTKQHRPQTPENYYEELRTLGYVRNLSKYCSYETITMFPNDGGIPIALTIADLIRKHPEPSKSLYLEYFTFQIGYKNYEQRHVSAS